MSKQIPNPPSPPLGRVIKEGSGHWCPNCGSTMTRSGFLRLFGKRYCDNEECKNSKSNVKNIAKTIGSFGATKEETIKAINTLGKVNK